MNVISKTKFVLFIISFIEMNNNAYVIIYNCEFTFDVGIDGTAGIFVTVTPLLIGIRCK